MTSPIVWEEDECIYDVHWGLIDGKLKYLVHIWNDLHKWSCVVERIGKFDQAETLEEAKRRCEQHLESVR
jgi:hypothetical protein